MSNLLHSGSRFYHQEFDHLLFLIVLLNFVPPFIGGVVKLIRCDSSIFLFTGQQLTAVNERTDGSSVSHWVVILKRIEHLLTKLFFTWLQILLSNINQSQIVFLSGCDNAFYFFYIFFIWERDSFN